MNEIKNVLNVENMIYEIRGKQVMLDSDLAKLYGVEKKRINEVVSRNPEKFPDKFCWKLTFLKVRIFWSQFATKKMKGEEDATKILEFLLNKELQCLLQY